MQFRQADVDAYLELFISIHLMNTYLICLSISHCTYISYSFVITGRERKVNEELMRLKETQAGSSQLISSSCKPKSAPLALDDPSRNLTQFGEPDLCDADVLRKLRVTLQLASLYAQQTALPQKACHHKKKRPITRQIKGVQATARRQQGLIPVYCLLFFLVIFGILVNLFHSVT